MSLVYDVSLTDVICQYGLGLNDFLSRESR